MNLKLVLILSMVTIGLSGCATAITRNGAGIFYTDTSDSVTATDLAQASKEGQACAMNYLGLVSIGNMTVDAAKKAGGIKKVASVDFTQNSILGVYAKSCTIVRGE